MLQGQGEAQCCVRSGMRVTALSYDRARRPHFSGPHTSLTTQGVLVNLSIMSLKALEHPFIDSGDASERPIEILTTGPLVRHMSFFLTTRKFGLFSSSEARLEHCKCI